MSYQNSIAKESLSLQNHIVRPCFIFITQNTPIMNNPDDEPSNWFILFNVLRLFSTLTQYMSASHGHNTMMIYGGGCEEKKGEDSLTSTRRINGLWRFPLIDINVSE